MKKILSGVAICLFPVFGFAVSDNTITFKGQVTEKTCDITVNGTSKSPIVLLPTVSRTDLTSPGNTAGKTDFTIDLASCPSGVNKAYAVFVGSNITKNGNLGNSGTANFVSVRLINDNATPLNFNSDIVKSNGAIISASKATIPLAAQYYAEQAVTAGSVVATVQYAITYE